MNGKRHLLDTNIFIALFAGDEQVRSRLMQAQEVFTSSVVIGELYYGAWKSQRVAENVLRIERLAATVSLLECGVGTAQRYGMLKNELRSRGKPIPENDIWIAATALEHGLVLVSRDQHFRHVSDLVMLEVW